MPETSRRFRRALCGSVARVRSCHSWSWRSSCSAVELSSTAARQGDSCLGQGVGAGSAWNGRARNENTVGEKETASGQAQSRQAHQQEMHTWDGHTGPSQHHTSDEHGRTPAGGPSPQQDFLHIHGIMNPAGSMDLKCNYSKRSGRRCRDPSAHLTPLLTRDNLIHIWFHISIRPNIGLGRWWAPGRQSSNSRTRCSVAAAAPAGKQLVRVGRVRARPGWCDCWAHATCRPTRCFRRWDGQDRSFTAVGS